ncbi:transcriptional regulator KorA [Xylella fastidiosa subsp. multiplex]|nr:transcriptional regulator KorA [Xylella fastidiosa subsp. multiplex]
MLVDGQQQTNVANTLGVTNKAVSYMVRKAWQTYIKHGERPEGWISISVTVGVVSENGSRSRKTPKTYEEKH